MFASPYSPLLLLTALTALQAQDLNSHGRTPDIRIYSDLVLINALVTDQHGRVITGLDASSFRIFEDGKEQAVKHCVSEDVPVSVGLVLDTSGSMSDKLKLMQEAAIGFVRAANPADEYFLVEFAARPRVVIPFTTDADQLFRSLAHIKAGGSTALFDAIHLAVQEMRHARNQRKAFQVSRWRGGRYACVKVAAIGQL
jgi:Ca-activated chloride channel homolog